MAKKKEKGFGKLGWTIFVIVGLGFSLALCLALLQVLYPEWRTGLSNKLGDWGIGQTVIEHQEVHVNQTITEITINESAWSGLWILLGVLAVLAALCFFVWFKFFRNKTVFGLSSPEKCQQIMFDKLTKLAKYSNIHFDGGHGTWFPPLCYNISESIPRVLCMFSTKRLRPNEFPRHHKESLILMDCNQRDPHNKFLPLFKMTLPEWEKKMRLFGQVYPRLDSHELEQQLSLFMEEGIKKGVIESMKEKTKEAVT